MQFSKADVGMEFEARWKNAGVEFSPQCDRDLNPNVF